MSVHQHPQQPQPENDPVSSHSPQAVVPRVRTRDFAQAFGQRVRELRTASGQTLRAFANRSQIDPSYLSKIERAEFAPPSNEKIVQLAQALGESPDALLAVAGRLAPDLPPIIFSHPEQFAELLRLMQDFTADELSAVRHYCLQLREERQEPEEREEPPNTFGNDGAGAA